MIFIKDVNAVTLDPKNEIIKNAGIVIDHDRIIDIGKASELTPQYKDVEVIKGRGMLALPGFIDAHSHSDQAILRSFADDMGWKPYLEDFIWPLIGHREQEDALISLKLCMLEMLKSGTTTFVDCMISSRYDFDKLAQAVVDMGMRAVLAKYLMPDSIFSQKEKAINTGEVESEEQSRSDFEQAIKTWNGTAGGRLQVWLGPFVPRGDPAPDIKPDFFHKVSGLAASHNTGITIHFASEREDIQFFQQEYGMQPVEFAQQYGLLGSNVMLINGCQLTEEEIPVLAETDTKIVHSPSANMKMASGIAKIPQMRAAGVTVALGCDAGANNNCLDMIREMKAASLLHNISMMDPKALIAEDVLEMATIDGARAIGQEDEIGSLEVGKQADIILVDLHHPHTMPVHDPVANLVYAAHGGNVDTVIVAGRVLMKNRKVLVVDEEAILAEAEERGHALLKRAGIRVAPEWPIE